MRRDVKPGQLWAHQYAAAHMLGNTRIYMILAVTDSSHSCEYILVADGYDVSSGVGQRGITSANADSWSSSGYVLLADCL